MEKYHEQKDLDMTFARRGVWLVKVPKYLSDSWKVGKPGCEVGKLKIMKKEGSKPDVIFCMNEAVRDLAAEVAANKEAASAGGAGSKSSSKVPLEHQFSLIPLGPQKLSILSTEQIPDTSQPEEEEDPLRAGSALEEVEKKIVMCEGRMSMVGSVIQRAECRPMNNDTFYLTHIRNRMEASNRPVNGIIQLDKTVNNYKPVAAHAHNVAADMKKKEEGKKTRSDEAEVMNLLFTAFEKYQYYNVKDLVRITKQPITFLKEVLKKLCLYNMKAPNKNTWELKPEYRHYKQQQPSGQQQQQHQADDEDDDDEHMEEVEEMSD